MRRGLDVVGKVLWGLIGAIVLAAIIAVLIITQSDWGRRQVLGFGLKQLASRVHGHVGVARLHGNLLTGARLDSVVITDSARRPFLRADTVELRYSLGSLLTKHLVLDDVRLVQATVVLDKPPGEEWNFARIFPTGPPKPHRGPGFGSWVLIRDMTIRRSVFMVRNEWSPPDSLSPSARRLAVERAMSPANRQWIVQVPGGYQSLSVFGNVNAELPVLRLADPDSATRLIDIARLDMVAFPFRPPAALVRDLRARVTITADSLLVDSVRVALAGTRAAGVGAYALNGSGARVQLALQPFRFEDGRFLYPAAPSGGGRMGLAFTSHRGRARVIASNMDVRAEGALVTGLAHFQAGAGDFRVGPSNVAFANVDTRLVNRHVPGDPLKVVGTLAGHLRLAGTTASMNADGWTEYRERGGPTSRVVVKGGVGSSPTGFVARGLRLHFEPLHLSLVRGYARDVPYRGRIVGDAELSGSSGEGFSLVADLVDTDPVAGRSHVLARGGIELRGGVAARNLRLRFQPLQVALLKPFMPDLPYGGTLSGGTTLTGSPARGLSLVADVTHVDPRYGRSRLGAAGRIAFRSGGLTADRLRLRFDPAQVALARPFVDDLPYGGTLTGSATLSGSTRSSMDVVADLVHRDAEVGRSHVTANGRVQLAGGPAARGLRLGLDPLQVAVLRPFVPRLPIDGTLTGRATVSGSPRSRSLAAVLDLEHNGTTGYSHVAGDAAARWSGRGFFDVDLRAPALSLATVGAFAPAAGLRGSASGDIAARGNLADLTTDLNLAIENGGAFTLRGRLDLAASRKRYDFTSRVTDFNAAAVTTHAPPTRLTGTILANGAGTDPATANALLDVNLLDSRAAGSPRLDTALVRARLAGGLATFERGHVRLGSALADIRGSFGLVAGRNGTLEYDVRVDTISQFAAPIPADTGSVRPRPMLLARRMAEARADSTRVARETEVQRAAVGYPAAPALEVDTLPMRRDTLAGSFAARGTLTGNVRRFDARGTVEARDLTVGSNHIAAGAASYSLVGYGTRTPVIQVDAAAQRIAAGGFAFDSGRAAVRYDGLTRHGNGSADITLFQDPRRDYRVRSDFHLALDSRLLRFQSLLLRFDTTTWRSTHPSEVAWGRPGATVRDLELRNQQGGYIRADGRLPTAGSADLRLDVQGLQVGDVTALVQDTTNIQGLLDLHARLQGTTRSPVIAGTAALVQASWGGKSFPDVRATIDYANLGLRANAQFLRGPLLLAVADGRLPVNLALADVTGPRVLRDRALEVNLRADSLPLDALPNLTTAVSDVRGRVRGDVAVRGTFADASLQGALQLDLGSLRVNPTGVLYTDIMGAVRLRADTALVDSLIAHSGGVVRVTGGIGLSDLTRPSFDLALAASDAMLLNNERGRVHADARLTVKGPYTGLKVTGDANITNGVLFAPEMRSQHATNLDDPSLAGILDTASLSGILPAPNPLWRNLQVDVALRISPDTWVRNSQANVEIYTPADDEPLRVQVDNARQTLTLLGSIQSDRGEYSYSGRVFQLSTGSATFTGGPPDNPLIHATAVYNVQRNGQEALAIQVNLSGTLKAPRVTLQSNAQPPLSQSDLLSYLAFGQAASSLLQLQGAPGLSTGAAGGLTGVPGLVEQQLASLALGAMVEQSVRDIEREGARAGLDVFRVRPGELPAEAAFEGYFQNFVRGTEVEAGKYVTPRLFVALRGRTSTWPGVTVSYREQRGFIWQTTYEPRYLPLQPSLASTTTATQVRSLGTFLLWRRRF